MPENVPEWAEGLPESMHSMPYLKDAATPEDFVTQVANAASHMGNSLRMPGPDAGDADISEFQAKVMEKVPGLMKVPTPDDAEGIAAVMGKLGKPNAAEEYKLPDGIDLDVDTLATLRAQAFGMDMTQAQFDAQVSALHKANETQTSERLQALETDRAALKEEWGYAYADRMGEVGAFLKADKDTPAQILKGFENDALDAATLRWLHRVSQLGDETPQVDLQNDGSPQGTLAPAEALAQLEEVERQLFHGDEGRPMKPTNERYQYYVDQRMRLMKMAYPDSAA